ncbi:hypothetical protein [Dankookia sp. P2]|uniref:hypothetical protein n=1 Tax=Dankookia sp. P2 TaxID=3423955 RepID=UPI003D67CACA
MRGQAWEQSELPLRARGRTLVNLGNTAPLAAGRHQLVVIHDAGAFDTPESYSTAFRAWYRALHLALPRVGARIVTVSEFSRGRIADHLKLDPARIGVMPEGAEHILRAPAEAGVLARHGLVPGRYALVVGNPAAHKNLAALAECAGLLGRHGCLLAVAGAADPAVFRQGSEAAGEAVRALGRVSDAELRALYEIGDLPAVPLPLRGLRPAAAGGHGVRLPGDRRRRRRGARGLRRGGALVRQ